MSRFGPSWAQHLPQWCIFDLDGTLANITHRLHLIEQEKPDWNAFNAACVQDEYKWRIGDMLRAFKECGRSIAIFTGRDETYRKPTEDWLKGRRIEYDLLAMRPAKDYRSDTIIKKEMFDKYFKKEDIWLVVDDRDKVVQMWRDLGLTVLQCQKGDY